MTHVVSRLQSQIICCFLLGAACGGLLFGWLGDKFGRVRAMTFSILAYSLFTGCGYFATQPWHLGAVFLPGGTGAGRTMVAGRRTGHGMLARKGPPAALRRDRRGGERGIPHDCDRRLVLSAHARTIGDG